MSLLSTSSVNVNYKCIVSSVLNKDVKQHGKSFMFDSNDDTAWSSNEGTPQWIAVQFLQSQTVSYFTFQFQGGFAGKNASVVIESINGEVICKESFYPEDINAIQKFQLKAAVNEAVKVKFIFNASTDFFGRIIVYKLEIFK